MTLSSLDPALRDNYQNSVVSLDAPEQLDAEAAVDVKSTAIAAMAGRPVLVLLNLSRLSTIQASGVAGLLELLREVRSRGGDLRLYGTSPALDVSQLQAHLGLVARIYPDFSSAVEGGTGPAVQRRRQHREAPAGKLSLKPGRLNWMRALLRP